MCQTIICPGYRAGNKRDKSICPRGALEGQRVERQKYILRGESTYCTLDHHKCHRNKDRKGLRITDIYPGRNIKIHVIDVQK